MHLSNHLVASPSPSITSPLAFDQSRSQRIISFIREIIKGMGEFFPRTLGTIIGKEILKVTYREGEKEKLEKQLQGMGKAGATLIALKVAAHRKLTEKVNTAEKVDLKGLMLSPKNFASESPKRVILIMNGMGDSYLKHLEAMQKLADDTGCYVASFDYRNGANSIGNFVADGADIYDYLKGKDFKAENILLYGHSMGGGVAAELHKQQNHQGPLLIENSFSKFSDAIKARRGRAMAWLFTLLHWEFNSLAAIKTADPSKVGLMVNRRDPIIPYKNASLYYAYKQGQGHGSAVGGEREFLRLKIGKKESKEALNEVSYKYGLKSIKVKSEKQPRSEGGKQAPSDYQQAMSKIKKEGGFKLLHRTPHDRVMSANSKVQPAVQSDENDISKVNRKHAQEDQQAYKDMLNMIKDLFEKSALSDS